MPLSRPPDVEKLTQRKDVRGLIDALGWEGSAEVRQAALQGLVITGLDATPQLIQALQHRKALVRIGAAAALALTGDVRSTQPLIVALGDPLPPVRLNAAIGLGALRAEAAIEPLHDLLMSDPDPDVVRQAAYSLAAIDPRTGWRLAGCLALWPSLAATAAAEVLVSLGDRAIPPLREALNNADPNYDRDLRQRIVRVLAQIGGEEAVATLIAILDDPDIAGEAVAALDGLGWAPPENENGIEYWITTGDWDRCVQLGEAAIPPLCDAIERGDSVGPATRCVIRIGGAAAKHALRRLLVHRPGSSTIIEAIADSGDPVAFGVGLTWGPPDAYEKLKERLFGSIGEDLSPLVEVFAGCPDRPDFEFFTEPRSRVVALADEVIRRYDRGSVVETLVAGLGSTPSVGLVETIGRAETRSHLFARIGNEMSLTARVLAFCPDARSAELADEVVSRFDGDTVLDALLAALADTPSIALIETMERLGDRLAAEPLCGLLADGENGERLRIAAAKALGILGDPSAVPALLQLVHDDAGTILEKRECVDALGKIEGAQADEALWGVFDRDPALGARALELLGEKGAWTAESLLARLDGITHSGPNGALAHPGGERPRALLRALGLMADQAAFEPLVEYWDAHCAERHEVPGFPLAEALAAIGNRKAIPRIIDSMFFHAYGPSEAFQPCLGDYADLLRDLIDGIEYDERWVDKDGYEGMKYIHGVDTHRMERALETLCRMETPVSSNILHKAAEERQAPAAYDDGYHRYREKYYRGGQDRVRHIRRAAVDELGRRGDPPYDPAAYLLDDWAFPPDTDYGREPAAPDS